MAIEEVLEKFKRQGNYAVGVMYGEDIGCDDIDVLPEDRRLQIYMTPIGYMGEVKKLVVTNLKELETNDYNRQPKMVSNPPKPEECRGNGSYVWGTESALKKYEEDTKNMDRK